MSRQLDRRRRAIAAVNAPLGRLIEMIGLPAALRLVDHFGGICIYVPYPGRVVARSKVAEVIGVEAMRRLAETLGPAHVMVPVGAAYMRAHRDRSIHADRAALSLSELARKYEMTERNVVRILAKVRGQTR